MRVTGAARGEDNYGNINGSAVATKFQDKKFRVKTGTLAMSWARTWLYIDVRGWDMLKCLTKPLIFRDSSSDHGGGAIWLLLGRQNILVAILNTYLDAH